MKWFVSIFIFLFCLISVHHSEAGGSHRVLGAVTINLYGTLPSGVVYSRESYNWGFVPPIYYLESILRASIGATPGVTVNAVNGTTPTQFLAVQANSMSLANSLAVVLNPTVLAPNRSPANSGSDPGIPVYVLGPSGSRVYPLTPSPGVNYQAFVSFHLGQALQGNPLYLESHRVPPSTSRPDIYLVFSREVVSFFTDNIGALGLSSSFVPADLMGSVLRSKFTFSDSTSFTTIQVGMSTSQTSVLGKTEVQLSPLLYAEQVLKHTIGNNRGIRVTAATVSETLNSKPIDVVTVQAIRSYKLAESTAFILQPTFNDTIPIWVLGPDGRRVLPPLPLVGTDPVAVTKTHLTRALKHNYYLSYIQENPDMPLTPRFFVVFKREIDSFFTNNSQTWGGDSSFVAADLFASIMMPSYLNAVTVSDTTDLPPSSGLIGPLTSLFTKNGN